MPEARQSGIVRTPAKVNLALHVGPRRTDGYHELCSVFLPVGLYDDLAYDLEGAPGAPAEVRVDVQCPGVECEANLVTHALHLVGRETGWSLSGSMRLIKRIPLAAGMGGGSSDAAVTLKLAAGLIASAEGPELSRQTLARLALELGADVPFFLDPSPCLAGGVGDELTPLTLPDLPLVLVFPQARLSTAEVYQTFDGVAPGEALTAFTSRCSRATDGWLSLSTAWRSGGLSAEDVGGQVAGLLYNDLEPAAFHLLPDLPALKSRLERHGVLGALVSGSGPTIFGLSASLEEAAGTVRSLDREGIDARCVVGGRVEAQ